jgi:type II secretory pathway component PulF
MFLSDFLREHWLPTLLVAAGALAALVYWLRTPAGVLLLDQLKLRTPVIRDIFIQTYLNQSLTVIGMSLANGVPITVALRAAQDVVGNSIFARFLKTILGNVEQGRGIAVGFNEATFIPPMVRQMIATGEQTGNVAKVMRRVADFYARELDKRVAAFAKMIEPIMLIVMGVVVGLLVSALILPIFKLSRAVH